MFSETELISTLQDCGIGFKSKGDELQLDRCPFCETDRRKKSDHCSFNRHTGQFHCVKCCESGNLITFRRAAGLDPFPLKTYRKPPEFVREYAKQPESYFEAFEQARGIPAAILKQYGIGKANHPEIGSCRTYPFIDEHGELVNLKYISAQKDMRQEKDTRKTYFGLQFVDFSKDYLHVTEGEEDCMALVAMGIDNVVSSPNGASSYTEDMAAVNRRFKKIYLCFDSDRPGEEGAEKFARKAGVWKCYRVDLPFKDARDCLKNGLDLFDIEKYKGKVRQYEYKPDDRCRPALSIDERCRRFEKECEENVDGLRFGIRLLDSITGGLRSDVFGIIANPGCFKTTALMNLLLRARTGNGIAIFFSLEMGIESEFERELQIATGHRPNNLRRLANRKGPEWEEIRRNIANTHGKLFVSEESYSSVAEIIDIIKRTEDVSGKECKIIGIDYLDFVKATQQKEYDAVREIMNALKSKIARAMKIPVIVLAQTNRNTRTADAEVTLRAGKGGTGIESACDYAIGLWTLNDSVVGKFNKHRRIDTYSGYPFPYFRLVMDKASYRVDDFVLMAPPSKGGLDDDAPEQWQDTF